MRALKGAQYRHVQGLSRGLSVLECLNLAPGGKATVKDLSVASGLHRTTVRRLLETLLTAGFVRRSESDDSYRLELAVRRLSEGFTDDEWIAALGTPALGDLLKAVRWPSDLSTLDGTSMIIRETTHRFSPLSFHRSMVGRRLPLLFTAAGRAYLAYCPAQERRELLRLMVADGGPQAAYAKDSRLVNRLLEKIRDQGYASNDGDWEQEAVIGAIALPVRRGAQVLGCINVVYLRRAVSSEQAANDYLPALQEAVQAIERALGTAAPRHG